MDKDTAQREFTEMFQAMGLLLTSFEPTPEKELSDCCDETKYGFTIERFIFVEMTKIEVKSFGGNKKMLLDGWYVYTTKLIPGSREIPDEWDVVDIISSTTIGHVMMAISRVILESRLDNYAEAKHYEEEERDRQEAENFRKGE